MAKLLRAISIRQPFVELILKGKKLKEYRSRLTHIRERVYVYASLTPSPYEEDWEEVGKKKGSLPTGFIVGSVEVVNCVYDDDYDCYAYVLENPKRLRKHLKATNQPQPGFWRPQFE